MDFPLFRKNSSVLEDFILLKGISQSGIDNFYEISNNLELHTGPVCESEFYTFFYKSRDQPLPNSAQLGIIRRDLLSNEAEVNEEVLEENERLFQEVLKEKGKI